MVSVSAMPAPPPITGRAPEVEGFCFRPRGLDATQAALNELLGTVAHELRSPFATILQAVEVIRFEGDLDPASRRAVAVLERQSRQALRLIEDLFDVCAGASGKLSVRKEAVSLAEVVAAATETASHLVAARRHRLTIALPPEPVILDADPLRLQQVLTNLLANAAKFTAPGGHIRLTAEIVAGQVVVRVRDNGRGIASDQLPRLFDRYYQALDSDCQRTGGLGIGLALVKVLVELHGGSVSASSDGPGTGSEFVVRLPARARGG
jgi:signal transduction histidine kinase